MEQIDIIKEINQAFANIQTLEIRPTKNNVILISGALLALEDAARGVAEMKNRITELEEMLQPEQEEESRGQSPSSEGEESWGQSPCGDSPLTREQEEEADG